MDSVDRWLNGLMVVVGVYWAGVCLWAAAWAISKIGLAL